MERGNGTKLSKQIKKTVGKKAKTKAMPKDTTVISTGSTLLDLAISGNIYPSGGIPGGILVEIFGPSGCGKTVLLSEIAGAVQRQGGQVNFKDPEARLNKEYAKIFGMDVDNLDYSCPDTVPAVFESVRNWMPEPKTKIHGVFADSLAALSTEMEMTGDDKMGMRRAKEFSEQLRKTCRILPDQNILMVCSNQVRQNMNAGPYGQKYSTPGGISIGFYASLRLYCKTPRKMKLKHKIAGKEITKIIGVETQIEIYKSSIDAPHQSVPVYIVFDYGIDDVRSNLIFIKTYKNHSVYTCNQNKLHNSIEKAIGLIEENDWQKDLKNETIELWHEINNTFKSDRKGKY